MTNLPNPPTSRRGLLGRFSGFTLSVILTTLASVMAIPALVALVGPTAWAQVAVAQTTATLTMVFVAFGWGATGPAMVAATPRSDRAAFYAESLRARILLFVVMYPVTVGLLIVFLRGDVWVAVFGALAYLLPALGGSWFFTGAAQPLRLVLCDSLPIVVGTLTGVGATALTGEVVSFLIMLAAGALAAVVIDAIVILHNGDLGTRGRRSIRSALWSQRHAVITAGTSTLYVTLPLLAVNWLIPAAAPTYAMADRLFRYASIAFLPIQQFFQGWVPESAAALPRRARIASLVGLAFGVLGGLCVALLSPILSPVLGAGQIHVPFSVSIPLGIAFIGIGVSAVVGYAGLVAAGRVHVLALSTVVGAIVGTPLILGAAIAHQLPWVAWAVAISEICVAGYQCVALYRALSPARRLTITAPGAAE